MKKRLKIYLGGKMSGLSFDDMFIWRSKCEAQLHELAEYYEVDVNVINPVNYYNFVEVRHKSEEEVMDYDLDHVESSDILIINLDKVESSPGTIIEITTAWLLGIPVLAFGDSSNLHPWVKRMIRRVDDTMEQMIDYIEDFYFC